MVTKVDKSRNKRTPPAKHEEPTRGKSRQLAIVVKEGVSADKQTAEMALGPVLANASTALDYSKALMGELSLQECTEVMEGDIQTVNGGNLDKMEGMLTGQAVALDAMFNNFAKRAIHADVMPKLEAYFRLALKAQAQCRATVEAIAEIKYPKSATFIKQANIAGQQQVNNGQPDSRSNTPAHEKDITPTTKLLSESANAALDEAGAGAAIGTNTQLEAVGAGNWTQNSGGQGDCSR